MFSSVTAAPISAEELDASYWVRNMISKVRFSDAVKALVSQSVPGKTRRKVAVTYSAAIEIGPAAALQGPLMQILTAHDERLTGSIMYTSMLARGINADVTALIAAGRLWAQGLNIDLHAVNFQAESKSNFQPLVNLPPYSWNHTKGFWHSSAWGKRYRHIRKPRTDLLGLRIQNQDTSEPRWQNFLRVSEQPWIADHRVQQMTLYPGAAMITMAIQAGHEMLDPNRVLKAIEASKILFKRPLLVPSSDTAVETAIHLRPVASPGDPYSEQYSFRMFSQAEDEEWQENCSGFVSLHYAHGRNNAGGVDWQSETSLYSVIQKRATRKLAPGTFYKIFDKKMNLQYGPLHQNVTECVAGMREGHGRITIPDTKAIMPSQFEYPHLIHPATLDSIFHMQALGYLHTLSGYESLVPISIESVYIAADISPEPGTELKGYSKSMMTENGDFTGDIVLSDETWTSPKAVVRGFLSRNMAATNNNNSAHQPRKCTFIQWEEFVSSSFPATEGKDVQSSGKGSVIMAKTPKVLILCSVDSAPGVQSLVEKLVQVLEGYNCTVRVAKTSELRTNEPSNLSQTTIISVLELDGPFVAKWIDADLIWFKKVISQTSSMLWVTRGGAYDTDESLGFSITTGLMRTLRVEMPQLKLPQIDLQCVSDVTQNQNIDGIVTAFESTIFSEEIIQEQEFVVRDDKLFVPRLKLQESFHRELSGRVTEAEPSEVRLANLTGPVEAMLEPNTKEFVWKHVDTTASVCEDEVEVLISTVSLELIDLQHSDILGLDAIGTIARVGSGVKSFKPGDTVVICASHTLKTSIVIVQDLVRHVPAFVDPNMLVTLPSALCTAEGALLGLGRLQPGETVVLATQPGSIEQALFSLATHIRAEVFVVAQDSKHEQILLESLDIDEDHVLMFPNDSVCPVSRNAKFDGKEIDLVVTTLTGNTKQALISLVPDFGRFVSIGGGTSSATTTSVPSNITVANFDLERLRITSPSKLYRLFKASWERAAIYGLPQTAPTRCFPLPKIEAAMAYLKGDHCFGSAILKLAPEHKISVPPPPPAKLSLDPAAIYVLAGGLGGIGRSIAEMMVEAGARNISFISRSAASSEDSQRFLDSLVMRGCNTQAFQCDITDPAQVHSFVTMCEESGKKIKGILQCAMVLRDAMFENMSFQQWSQATDPKVQGSWNLHKYMPADLDFFIMLSSMAGVIGNPGQANYSAAGTYQDALSQHRRSKGLTSMTIDLGIVSDVGYIAENPEQFERLDYLENLFISERDLHVIMSAAMLGQTRDGEAVPAQLVTGIGKELLAEGSLGSAMSGDLKYAELHDEIKTASGVADSSEDALIKENLRSAASVREACTVVENVLSSQLAKALNMEAADVDLEKPMHAFGVDSLVAVEVKNMIFRRMNAEISVFDILSTMPLARLAIKVASKSKFVREDIALLAQDEVIE